MSYRKDEFLYRHQCSKRKSIVALEKIKELSEKRKSIVALEKIKELSEKN